MSGIVPVFPGLRKVGVLPTLVTASPVLAAISRMYLPLESVASIPHSTALALKSPATTAAPSSSRTKSSIPSTNSLNSWVFTFGVR
uniref:Uncharacterized protein n=1 Tax=Panstrongylus lignarius TaxID=156445 RepID=A0A224XS63_9HEMI